MKTNNPLATDLTYVLDHTVELWDELRGKRIFITGGTGFFGCWLLESFCWVNDLLNLGASVVVLTRNIEAFAKKVPHLVYHPAISFHVGDVRNYTYPDGEFSHIIHAATAVSSGLEQQDPQAMLETIVDGTRHTLDFAVHAKADRLLFTSSGAVYGRQSTTLERVTENYDTRYCNDSFLRPSGMTTYGMGKRDAEKLCEEYVKLCDLEITIARCFAFIGPYMPLAAHFAIGNFILNGLRGEIIRVHGDGTPYRSYLYAADLMIRLWYLLMRGKSCCAYNVGSDQAINIAAVARLVAMSFQPAPEVVIEQRAIPNQPAERYVPSTALIENTFNLKSQISLVDAIEKTKHWYAGNMSGI